MIEIKPTDGPVVKCDRLVGIAIDGGRIIRIVDGQVDLIDVLTAKRMMEELELTIVEGTLMERASKDVRSRIQTVNGKPSILKA